MTEGHMAARKWTSAQRAEQALKIYRWQPWQHSTGARTPEGKAKVGQNARRFTFRKGEKLAIWFSKQVNNLRQGRRCASIIECEHRLRQCGISTEEIKKQQIV